MNALHYVAVSKAALKYGVPAKYYAVLHGIMRHANTRGECHPGTRALADLCNESPVTVTAAVRYLERHGIVNVTRQNRSLNRYRIQPQSRWGIKREAVTASDTDLHCKTVTEPSTDSVTASVTDEFSKIHENCDSDCDVNIRAASAAISPAVAGESILEASGDAIPEPNVIPFPKSA